MSTEPIAPSDSESNTSTPADASAKRLFLGALGEKDLWVPIFHDSDGNEYVFLYQDAVSENRDEALAFAVHNMLDMMMLGVRFVETRLFPRDVPVKNVTCMAVNRMTGTEYKVAIIGGPVFRENYTEEAAEENDRITYESQVRIGQESLDANAG